MADITDLIVEVVGMEKMAAIIKIENAYQIARITAEDDEEFMHTMDFRDDRVNLRIVGGKVAVAYRG